MSDEKTREVPLTDVMGIAEVSDEPTETLPAVDDPGEAKTESFQKPFDGGPEAQRKFESQDEAESLETSGQDMRGSFAGRSARPTGSVKSADPAKSAEPVGPSKQVRIGKTDGELVIRPSGPSAGTIVLGVFFCLIGLMLTWLSLVAFAWLLAEIIVDACRRHARNRAIASIDDADMNNGHDAAAGSRCDIGKDGKACIGSGHVIVATCVVVSAALSLALLAFWGLLC